MSGKRVNVCGRRTGVAEIRWNIERTTCSARPRATSGGRSMATTYLAIAKASLSQSGLFPVITSAATTSIRSNGTQQDGRLAHPINNNPCLIVETPKGGCGDNAGCQAAFAKGVEFYPPRGWVSLRMLCVATNPRLPTMAAVKRPSLSAGDLRGRKSCSCVARSYLYVLAHGSEPASVYPRAGLALNDWMTCFFYTNVHFRNLGVRVYVVGPNIYVGIDLPGRRRSDEKVACPAGRKTEKHVPERPGRRELQTRIEPPMRSTIPALTHNPRPVPFSPFVVKKGW